MNPIKNDNPDRSKSAASTSAPLVLACPSCGYRLRLAYQHLGLKGNCVSCSHEIMGMETAPGQFEAVFADFDQKKSKPNSDTLDSVVGPETPLQPAIESPSVQPVPKDSKSSFFDSSFVETSPLANAESSTPEKQKSPVPNPPPKGSDIPSFTKAAESVPPMAETKTPGQSFGSPAPPPNPFSQRPAKLEKPQDQPLQNHAFGPPVKEVGVTPLKETFPKPGSDSPNESDIQENLETSLDDPDLVDGFIPPKTLKQTRECEIPDSTKETPSQWGFIEALAASRKVEIETSAPLPLADQNFEDQNSPAPEKLSPAGPIAELPVQPSPFSTPTDENTTAAPGFLTGEPSAKLFGSPFAPKEGANLTAPATESNQQSVETPLPPENPPVTSETLGELETGLAGERRSFIEPSKVDSSENANAPGFLTEKPAATPWGSPFAPKEEANLTAPATESSQQSDESPFPQENPPVTCETIDEPETELTEESPGFTDPSKVDGTETSQQSPFAPVTAPDSAAASYATPFGSSEKSSFSQNQFGSPSHDDPEPDVSDSTGESGEVMRSFLDEGPLPERGSAPRILVQPETGPLLSTENTPTPGPINVSNFKLKNPSPPKRKLTTFQVLGILFALSVFGGFGSYTWTPDTKKERLKAQLSEWLAPGIVLLDKLPFVGGKKEADPEIDPIPIELNNPSSIALPIHSEKNAKTAEEQEIDES